MEKEAKIRKVYFYNSKKQKLAGILEESNKSKDIIIMTHGFTGDKNVFTAISKNILQNGFNVLRFDFSGCGESEDTSLTIDKQMDDLKSAIKFVKNKGFENIALVGYSLGGLISIKVYDKQIKTIILLAPLTDSRKDYRKKYSKEQLEELNSKGYITKISKGAIREKVIIDKKIIEFIERGINQRELLSNVKCPVLIIHGDKDDRVPLEFSKKAIKYLSQDSRLEILKGADHKNIFLLENYINSVSKLCINWFKKYLK